MTQASELRSRLLTAIQSREHKVIVFDDLDDVPVGSSGYLSPSGRSAALGPYGWVSHDVSYTPPNGQTFTSHSGPANDAKLAELIEAALVPEKTILVSFEAVTDTETDWELGYSAKFTDLANPMIIGHRLNNDDLAHLHFQIEEVGGLGESSAYRDLEKQIEELGEKPAEELRKQAERPAGGGLFDLGTASQQGSKPTE